MAAASVCQINFVQYTKPSNKTLMTQQEILIGTNIR